MASRVVTCLAAGLLCLGCQHVVQDGESTRIRTLGAGTVTVYHDGTVETSSPGLSEGFSGVLTYTVKAAANFARAFMPFSPPAPAVDHTHSHCE